MENKCSNCESEFKRRPNNKGYYRFSLDNTLPQSDSIAKDALGNLTGSQFTPVSSKRKGKFMCPSCWSKLADTVQYRRKVEDFWSCTEHGSYIGQKRKGTNEQSGTSKVPRFTTSTPASSREHTQPGDTSFERLVITPVKVTGTVRKTLFKPSKTAKWDTIVKAVRTRQYGRAISGLFHATKGSQKQFLKFLKRTIRKEVSSLIHEEIALGMETTIPNIGSFSWNDVISQLKIQSPVLETVLRSAITTPSTEETLKRAKSINLKPHLGIAAATLLHARAPRKVNFLQTLLSIQFWRGGLKRETIKQLAHTGICMSYAHTLNAVDKIREGFDKAATASKEGVEQSLGMAKEALIHQTSELELSVAMANTVPNIEDEVNAPSDAGDNLEDDANDVSDGEDAHTDDDADADEVVSDESDEECKDGNELEDTPPIESTITNEPVADEVHGGFTLCWDNVGKKVISRNPSETRKNAYMNMALGYMAINRVPTTGLNSAATDVKQACDMNADCFLPHVGDFCELRNRMSTIIERYICRHLEWFKTHFSEVPEAHILHEHSYQSSKKSVILNLGVFDENPCSTQGAIGIYQRLQKYVPSANDEPIKILVYGDGLSCERGNDAHRARSNGQSAWERLDGLEPAAQEFHKEMILLQDYFDEFFSASSSSDRGTLVQLKNLFNFRTVKADISDNFTHAWELMCLTTEGLVCLHVMEILGMETPLSRPTNAPPIIERGSVDEKKAYISEVSKTVVDALWHETDTSKLHEVPPTPPTYTYCVCHVDLGDDVPMIGCENGESCFGDEWYHYRCIGMKQEDVPKDDWYCHACRKKGPMSDSKRNHSIAIAWRGLNLLCRRDAVREGDGPAIVSFWKLDIISFLSKRHPKYFILAHRLLASLNGWLPERLRHDLIWNRTVNYGGGIGRNLPMDLMNEILNRLFKDLLCSAQGRYTDTTVQRCGQLVGPLGESLDSVFDSNVIENEVYRHRRRSSNRDSNVHALIEFLLDERLFSYENGRHHRAFPAFTHDENPKNPRQFAQKVKKLAKKLDRRRGIIINA